MRYLSTTAAEVLHARDRHLHRWSRALARRYDDARRPGSRTRVQSGSGRGTSRGAQPAARRGISGIRSDLANVLCFLALPAGGDVELDTLTLVERLVAVALDVREVDEHIVALLPGNEAEALLSIEELHGACSQVINRFVLDQTTCLVPGRVTGRRRKPRSAPSLR